MTPLDQKTAFNWDEDFEDLVRDDAPKPAPVAHVRPAGDDYILVAPVHSDIAATGGLRAGLARWFAPALVVAGLAGAVAFPDMVGLGRQTVQTASLFPTALTDAAPIAPTVTLVAYSPAQSRSFVAGLARFSDADLLAYARTTQTDLARAGHLLGPLMQDALTLTRAEIARRNLSAEPVMRAVEDVRINAPLQG